MRIQISESVRFDELDSGNLYETAQNGRNFAISRNVNETGVFGRPSFLMMVGCLGVGFWQGACSNDAAEQTFKKSPGNF